MYKDFDNWNEKKKSLELINSTPLFKEREVWWCSVGINVARESCGKGKQFQRPVLILRKLSKFEFIGIPLTTKLKKSSWNIFLVVDGKQANAQINQIRMFSSNRLQRRVTVVELVNFNKIKQKLETMFEL